jgi:tRNA(Ile)-lysidine synthase
VLLHSFIALRLPDITVQALHIDHGLQASSREWSEQCVAWADNLGISCKVIKVNARHQSGESPEDAARKARYEALASFIEPGDILLTAHHCDDQAETLLLQLLRGSGPLGLASMGKIVSFGQGHLCRPLLDFIRAELEHYARQHGLEWIDDPSNEAIVYDRNYLRHQVSPRLAERWPSWQRVVGRAAAHQAEMALVADDLAQIDIQQVADVSQRLLRIDQLLVLPDYRQRNLLRYWIRLVDLPLPTSRQLWHIRNDVLNAAPDRLPVVKWPGAEVRRYRNNLYVMAPLAVHDHACALDWDPRIQPTLDTPTGALTVEQLVLQGLDRDVLNQGPLEIRYRRGGEKIRLKHKSMHQDLKTLFQEAGVPPWQRDRIPFVFRGEKLLAVAGYWIAE